MDQSVHSIIDYPKMPHFLKKASWDGMFRDGRHLVLWNILMSPLDSPMTCSMMDHIKLLPRIC